MISNPRFCPQCGTALQSETIADRVRPVCPGCGFIFYLIIKLMKWRHITALIIRFKRIDPRHIRLIQLKVKRFKIAFDPLLFDRLS